MKNRADYNTIIPTDLRTLVCSGLNYCCLDAFFRLYAEVPSSVIGLRLGLDPRTVRKWKARWRAGEFQCAKSASCLALRLSLEPKKTHHNRGDVGHQD